MKGGPPNGRDDNVCLVINYPGTHEHAVRLHVIRGNPAKLPHMIYLSQSAYLNADNKFNKTRREGTQGRGIL
jgi:hypothetical protein